MGARVEIKQPTRSAMRGSPGALAGRPDEA